MLREEIWVLREGIWVLRDDKLPLQDEKWALRDDKWALRDDKWALRDDKWPFFKGIFGCDKGKMVKCAYFVLNFNLRLLSFLYCFGGSKDCFDYK